MKIRSNESAGTSSIMATATVYAAACYFNTLSGLVLDENGVGAVGSRESFLDLVVLAFTSLLVPPR